MIFPTEYVSCFYRIDGMWKGSGIHAWGAWKNTTAESGQSGKNRRLLGVNDGRLEALHRMSDISYQKEDQVTSLEGHDGDVGGVGVQLLVRGIVVVTLA